MQKIPGRNINVSDLLRAADATATFSEINAGKTMLAGAPRANYRVSGFRLSVNTAAINNITTLVVQTNQAVPVVLFSVAVANLTNGAIFTQSGATGLTIGAGFNVALGKEVGIVIGKTGAGDADQGAVALILEYRNVGE